jgi:acyl carrier protein
VKRPSRTAEETVCLVIGQALPGAAIGTVTPSMDLRGDLGVDSVGLMSIVFLLEEETGIDAFALAEDFVAAERVDDIVAIVRRTGALP